MGSTKERYSSETLGEATKGASGAPPPAGLTVPQMPVLSPDLQAKLDAAWAKHLDKHAVGFDLAELKVR